MSKSKNEKQIMKDLAPFLTLGIEMMLYIVIFTFIGYWIDNKIDSSPIFTIILAFLGIFAGFYKFFKSVLKFNNNKNKKS